MNYMSLSSLIHTLIELLSDVGDCKIIFCADEKGTFNGIHCDEATLMDEDGKPVHGFSFTLKNYTEEDRRKSDLENVLNEFNLGMKGIKVDKETGEMEVVESTDLPDDIRKSLENGLKKLFEGDEDDI